VLEFGQNIVVRVMADVPLHHHPL